MLVLKTENIRACILWCYYWVTFCSNSFPQKTRITKKCRCSLLKQQQQQQQNQYTKNKPKLVMSWLVSRKIYVCNLLQKSQIIKYVI